MRVIQVEQNTALARGTWGENARQLFGPFLIELVATHQKRFEKSTPRWTGDPSLQALWCESPLDEWDQCGINVANGLENLANTLREHSELDVVSAIAKAAAVARWLGSHTWCTKTLQQINSHANILVDVDPSGMTSIAVDLIQDLIAEKIQLLRKRTTPTCSFQ